jgi:predicted CXXCH cytochrome family protein
MVVEPKVPVRWLAHGEFSHRKHDKVPCETCHPMAAGSVLTSDVNLPGLKVCLQCHTDGAPQSAGTECLLCHLYHDTTKDPAKRAKGAPELTLDKLLGRTP